METDETLKAFAGFCKKVSKLINGYDKRIKFLEEKVEQLEKRPDILLTQMQVAQITGWSIAAVGRWAKTGFIKSVKVEGREKPMIPASEIDEILAKKGNGKKLPDEQ